MYDIKDIGVVRFEKADKIVSLYNRKHRQEDIAKILQIPLLIVRNVLQAYNFEHTKEKHQKILIQGKPLIR